MAERFRFAHLAAGNLHDHLQQSLPGLRQCQLTRENATGVKVHVVDHALIGAAVAGNLDQR